LDNLLQDAGGGHQASSDNPWRQTMPTVGSVLETSLYVQDLTVAIRFYEELFDFPRLAADERFCALSVSGKHVLLLFRRGGTLQPLPMPGGILPAHDGSGEYHVAFSIDADELNAWERKLMARGIELESKVHWPLGGHSLYFRDPDRNLLELVTPGVWAIY
jgi:catechol 2,3-dioxygenase-like lactoylglutathione lyase family enzyme